MTTPSVEVARLRWRPFRLTMRHRFQAAHGALEDREGVLVELTDRQGHTGIGEASPMSTLGQGTAGHVLALIEALGASVAEDGAISDGPGANALRCAVDVARLDLRARVAGVPVAALLAEGVPASWVMANAVIGGGPAHEVARYGHEAVQAGYAVLKVKVGGVPVGDDYRRLSALREACPEAIIRLDANGSWDEATARGAIEAFRPLAIELIEQPTPAGDIDALARIRDHAPMRIAADESLSDRATAERVLDLRAADMLVLKPMLLGGLTAAATLANRAAERGIGAFVTTTFDSSVGTAAALHLAASLPADAAHGLGTGEHLATDLTAATMLPTRGRLALPDGPGLGVTVDEGALEAAATGPWSELEL